MKIALAQINATVGDFEGNVAKIKKFLEAAQSASADLVVFPELALCGYPPRDLLDRRSFLHRNRDALEEVASGVGDFTAVVGFVEELQVEKTSFLFNAAAVLRNGKIVEVHRKSLLPTYDVFDEDRHFEPASDRIPSTIENVPVGITICEDIWKEGAIESRRSYPVDPPAELVDAGAQILINLSASPYHLGREADRLTLVEEIARKHKTPVFLCNLVGGNDELVFDGNSVAVNSSGTLIAAGKAFEEDLVIVDSSSEDPLLEPPPRFRQSPSPSESMREGSPRSVTGNVDSVTRRQARLALELGIRDYVGKCRFRDVLVGLSGGIDSALVAALAASSLGKEHVTGVAMPSPYSSPESVEDARALASNLGIRFSVIPIRGVFTAFRSTLEEPLRSLGSDRPDKAEVFDLTEQNIQARIRGDILMALSNFSGAILLSTGNKSEMSVGYCTLYGDLAGGLAAISDVPKILVYEICRDINRDAGKEIIPERTLTKPPSAELKPNQQDTDSLPPYEELDPILRGFVEEERGVDEMIAGGLDPDLVRRVVGLVVRSEYKRRQAPPGLRITTKAFGSGRRIPIAQKFRG